VPGACGAVSAVVLVIVDGFEEATGWAAAHVLADVALMTPIVPLLWWTILR
jgi:hypothetical protein